MPAGYLVYGPPNEFPDPAVDLPYHSADDPHAPALILRTCLLMKKNGVSTVTADALMQRSWDYLEMMWRTTGEMAFTWSPYPDEKVWYAHMHAEILETLAQCVKLSVHLPAGIPLATVKLRIMQTTIWLKRYGVGKAYNGDL